MNVLRVIASVDPKSGGPIEGLKATAGALRGMGQHTEVVTLDDPSASFLAECDFPVFALGSWTKKYRYTPHLSRWVSENAARFQIAVVHGLWNHASVGGWHGLRRAGLPYVVFTHGMMDPWFRRAYPFKHVAKQAFWLAWQGRVLRDADTVLFTSEEEKRLARNAFWGHDYTERVVAYGAAEPPAPSERQISAFRASVPSLGQRRYLLFMSRIHPKKGCDMLVDAFAEIASQDPETDLVMAGPDQIGWQNELNGRAEQAGIAHRIHWPGMLTGDTKWGAFRAAEAFVLPSHSENFGIVVAEALACGLPVLISNKVNIWREIKSAGAGLIANDDQQGIEQMIKRFLGLDKDARTVMKAAARQCYLQHFEIGAASRNLLDILESLRS